MDWLRGQNVIIIEIYMDFGDLSLFLSLSLSLLRVCDQL